ncbi:MAG: nucleotide exchange factor GrpE [Ralstonia sp.]|uniref:nucleotide exchange factor GrpE n=1 Tax=Ralstonia sp. TaxID=54061 RepID=UPI000D2B00AE|nr:nucleotide exchange factor GrpE [Ralstonia sp.]MBA4232484.1 nucleotide exchange factor GrpE [Ralstonia sp.]PPC83282.1 MAG: nucleotide exchange factor GrpE [Hyphomicrobium sp.]
MTSHIGGHDEREELSAPLPSSNEAAGAGTRLPHHQADQTVATDGETQLSSATGAGREVSVEESDRRASGSLDGSLAEIQTLIENNLSEQIEAKVQAALGDTTQLLRARLTRDEQFSSMQRELEGHRGDQLLKSLRPLVTSVITTHDNVSKIIDRVVAAGDTMDRGEVSKILKGILEDLELALSQNGIDVFGLDNVGETFDGKSQRTVGFVETDDSNQHGRVAENVRAGFASDSVIVQKQRVKVYRARSTNT